MSQEKIDRQHVERTARSAVLALFGAALVVSLAGLVLPDATAYYLSFGALLLGSATAIHVLRGRLEPRTVARTVLAIGGGVSLVSAVLTGGVESPAYVSYGVVLVGAAWLVFEPRGALAVVASLIVVGGLLAWAGDAGVLPQPWVTHTTRSRWVVAAAACVLFSVVQWLEVQRLRSALRLADAELEHRQRAQADAARAEARYAEVVSTVPGMVYEFEVRADGSRAFTFASAGSQWLLGVAPEAIIRDPRTLFDLVVPRHLAALEASIAASRETLTPWEIEGAILTPAGQKRWLRGQALPRALADGTVQWKGVLTDFTARFETERALRASEDRFRSLTDSIPQAFWQYDIPAARLVDLSSGFARLFGIPTEAAEADPRLPLARLVPSDRDRLIAGAGAWIDAGCPDEFSPQIRIVRDAGVIRDLQVRITHVVRSGDAVVRIGGLVEDITERLQAESALKASLSMLKAALESTADGLLIVGVNGQVTGYNQKFLSLWRIPVEVAESRQDRRLLWHVTDQLADPGEFLARVNDIYSRPDAVSLDTIRFKDGRHFERYSQPHVVDGVSIGRVWSFRDVTLQMTHERERRALERQIQHAHQMEALGTLAGGIAHDFNNLLAVIVGQAAIAQQEPAGSAQIASSIREIAEAGARASEIVREIREFGQPQPPDRAMVDGTSLVRDAASLLRSTLPKSVTLHMDLRENVPVFADATQLRRLVSNLVVNAGQACGEDGRIDVALDRVTPDQLPSTLPRPLAAAYARLSVTDTGHGMDAEVQTRIFEPFFTTKEAGRGSGLGLAVVHGIVQRHGGAISVESEPGRGSRFEVFLPAGLASVSASVSPVDAGLDAREPASVAPVAAAARRDVRILVVDDEDAVLRILRLSLERMGYHVTAVADPRAALTTFEASSASFDLVFTDLSMPYMSGVDLGRRILELRPDVGVVLITGFSAEVSPELVRELGFRGLVHKPVTPAALAEIVHRALNGSDRL